ncbi:MAG: hypothetical protein JWM34_978 [Ilumatobacteraceae bacterium]|nr:hypothetical protein [Ilumatobacteraceae bacterium]
MSLDITKPLDALAATPHTTRELLDQAKAVERSDTASALALAEQACSLSRSHRDVASEAEAIHRLASIAFASGRADDAFGLAVDARDLARSSGAVVVEAWALSLMGAVHLQAGNHTEALACCLRGLELYRTTDHRVDEGHLLHTIAAIHHSLGDSDRAIVTYDAALSANRLLVRPDFDAVTLANMARLRAERDDHLLAVSLGESALGLAREHAPKVVPDVLATLGEAYANIGDIERAEACFDEAVAVLDERPASGIAVHTARGRVALASGDPARAEADLLTVVDAARRAHLRPAELVAHELLATVYRRLGRFEEALAHQEARFDLHRDLFDAGADLRLKTLQISYDTEHARQQAEILRLRTGELEDLVRGRTHELEEYQLEAFQRLAVLAEFRDTDTGEHTIRVGDLSAEVAAELGEDPDWCQQIRLAARLHDIGKVAVPDTILLKPGPLTADEFEVMKTHTTIGAQILSGSSSPLIQLGAVVAQNHHERWDGTGYPVGLSGTDIPRCGRIVTVADVFDALTSVRVYKHAWSHADAVDYVVAGKGAQFEPEVVDAFLRVIVRRLPALRNRLD